MKQLTAFTLPVLLLATACAPVANSVPKLSTTSPRTKDSILSSKKKDRVSVKALAARVYSSEKYERFEKKLDADYDLLQIREKETKLSELRELNSVRDIDFGATIRRLDVLITFVTKSGGKELSELAASTLDLVLSQQQDGKFTLTVSQEGKSGEVWSAIKSDLVSVTIAYREAKTND